MIKYQTLFIGTPTVAKYLMAADAEKEVYEYIHEKGKPFRSEEGRIEYTRLLEERAAALGLEHWITSAQLWQQLIGEYVDMKADNKAAVDADVDETLSLITAEDLNSPVTLYTLQKAEEEYGELHSKAEELQSLITLYRENRELLTQAGAEEEGHELHEEYKRTTQALEKIAAEDVEGKLQQLRNSTAYRQIEIERSRRRYEAFLHLSAIIYPMKEAYKVKLYDLQPLAAKLSARLTELGIPSPGADAEAAEAEQFNNQLDAFPPYLPWAELLQPEIPTADPAQTAIPGFFDGEKKQYRTRRLAGDVASLPDYTKLMSLPGYESALTFYRRGKANLEKVKQDLEFKDGSLYISGELKPLSEAKLKDLFTDKEIENVDLVHLKGFFSLFYEDYRQTKELRDVIKLYIPELAEYFTGKRHVNKEQREALLTSIKSYHNIVGVMKTKTDGRKKTLPVLLFAGEDEEKNTVSILSPYMTNLISEVEGARIKTNKTGLPELKASGEPQLLPAYTDVKPSIHKEKAKLAAEMACQIVVLIAQAGKGTPHIAAQTLFERTPQATINYSKSANKQQFLKRLFSNLWRILREDTYLTEQYKNIVLPDPADVRNIPTPKTLSTMTFSFPHEGRIAGNDTPPGK